MKKLNNDLKLNLIRVLNEYIAQYGLSKSQLVRQITQHNVLIDHASLTKILNHETTPYNISIDKLLDIVETIEQIEVSFKINFN